MSVRESAREKQASIRTIQMVGVAFETLMAKTYKKEEQERDWGACL